MSHQEQIISFLKANEKRMFTLLEEMVLIQSGSWNKKGVDKVNELICSHLTPHQFSFEVHEQKEFGNHLVVRSPSFSPDVPQILLTGHMDTVFPVDTDFNFYKENQNRCFGPGVADMKGGLVVGIYALLALQDTGLLSQMPVTFIFNSDEEIGSRTSRKLILSEAKKSCAGFVFESGGLDNSVVSGRKGNISATLTIEGEDGHAAFAVKNKASAILELAQKTIEIENLNDPDAGISSNVGKIKGGI
ncbi:MAG: M20 family metallopeptidase, partial [Desulfobacteraceae bacterium]|nr:M20 family metallopeptidase [Desulfobacteraceae bacterium]